MVGVEVFQEPCNGVVASCVQSAQEVQVAPLLALVTVDVLPCLGKKGLGLRLPGMWSRLRQMAPNIMCEMGGIVQALHCLIGPAVFPRNATCEG